MNSEMRNYLLETFKKKNVIQFGNFTLKSGQTSQFYIDLRILTGFPSLLKKVAESIAEKVAELSPDLICGVPYAAIPLATIVSLILNIPMVIARKEAKSYGTKKTIEGIYSPHQTCVVIEDVITTGMSILETIKNLEEVGLKVEHIVALFDREQNGKPNLADKGYHLHSILTLKEVLS